MNSDTTRPAGNCLDSKSSGVFYSAGSRGDLLLNRRCIWDEMRRWRSFSLFALHLDAYFQYYFVHYHERFFLSPEQSVLAEMLLVFSKRVRD